MKRFPPNRLSALLLSLLFASLVWLPAAQATEGYAARTGKGCIFCHEQRTGGDLRAAGLGYIRGGYRYPIPHQALEEAERLSRPFHSILRWVLGYLHILAGIVFLGAIFYIHILVRPARLTSGIPKHERVLGLSCMAALTATGTYLTWVRIGRWERFFDNTFGLVLFVKIGLFLLMMGIGLLAVTAIHHRMARDALTPGDSEDADEITGANLSRFDGSGDKPAYVVVEGAIYDVSESPKWEGGRHFGKHAAGADLTSALGGAPHGSEVLEKVRRVGEMSGGAEKTAPSSAHRIFVFMAYTNLVIVFLIIACLAAWRWGLPFRPLPDQAHGKAAAAGCATCHRERHPGLVADWAGSVHAHVNVDCLDCHRAGPDRSLVSKTHLRHDRTPVQVVVSPRTCGACHPDEAAQYGRSKHAHTREIMWKVDPWLRQGMNNDLERTTGCYACHGTQVQVTNGRPAPGTWPNVGVGRMNPDGSLGSCSSCHTRHRFSAAEARKPEACDQCHLGPDHPQIEIYNESKHGTLYHAEGAEWTWKPEDGLWTAGRDYRAPTCAACHMSAAGAGVPRSHDVTGRLAWETQAPLTIRPSDFAPFPAKTNWKAERLRMKAVCLQCHSEGWTGEHFDTYDRTIDYYNQIYYLPARQVMDDLYARGRLSAKIPFDEPLEWEFYELWHHEGRRARMGTAMMAPDYAWWHGFYELKHRFTRLLHEAEALRSGATPTVYPSFPGRYGSR